MSDIFEGKSVLITGGTGSLGSRLAARLLNGSGVDRVVVFSRDELKQWEQRQRHGDDPRLRFFIGDVRDVERLRRAFTGIDYVVHAAALKQVPAAEYNPFEAVKTNILGAKNIIDAAIDCGVQRVIALSTDKACSPVNLYGATKLVSDKLFVDGNAYAADTATRLAVVRYGNVVGSRGSVVHVFRQGRETGKITVTHPEMTRFWITIEQAVDFVLDGFRHMRGGEIFVPKIPSMRVVDLAEAIAPDAKVEVTGIRSGEKLHEELISVHDARATYDVGQRFVIEPELDWWEPADDRGRQVGDRFVYDSQSNPDFLSVAQLREMLDGI